MTPFDLAVASGRFLQYAGTLVLCGGSLFCVYGLDPKGRRWPGPMMTLAGLTAAAGVVVWLVGQAGVIAETWAAAVDPATLSGIALGTGFGRAAAIRFVLSLLAAGCCALAGGGRLRWSIAGAVGAAAVASFAWSGHAAAGEGLGGAMRQAVDVVHLLAAATWIGALAVLVALMIEATGGDPVVQRQGLAALQRFSALGVAVVAILTLSGVLNSWFLIAAGSPLAALASDYGKLLILKLVLFAGMLALAYANRRLHTPKLEAATGALRFGPVLGSIAVETTLAVSLLAVVSLLGMTPPPGA